MSIRSEANRILANIAAAYTAAAEKGAAVPENQNSDNLPAAILSIQKGVVLPALTNPASESDIGEGKEVIDASGNKITGTFTLDSELTDQDTLISQIQTALEGKAAGGGGSGSSSLISFTLIYGSSTSPLTQQFYSPEDLNWGMWFFSEYNTMYNGLHVHGLQLSEEQIFYYAAVGTPSITLDDVNVNVFDKIQDGAVYYATYTTSVPDQQ